MTPRNNEIGAHAAARLLGVTPMTIWRWTQTGYLPAVRAGERGGREAVYNRTVVERLAELRAEASVVMNTRRPLDRLVSA